MSYQEDSRGGRAMIGKVEVDRIDMFAMKTTVLSIMDNTGWTCPVDILEDLEFILYVLEIYDDNDE